MWPANRSAARPRAGDAGQVPGFTIGVPRAGHVHAREWRRLRLPKSPGIGDLQRLQLSDVNGPSLRAPDLDIATAARDLRGPSLTAGTRHPYANQLVS
jgi:hypothetical protein